MGLTGYIASLTLQLPALPGRAVRRTVVPVGDLVEAVDVMTARRDTGEALYSWNDLNRRGRGFGRGMVFAESFVDRRARRSRATVPAPRAGPAGSGAPGGRPPGRGGREPRLPHPRAPAAGRRALGRGRGLPDQRQRGLLPALRPAGVPRVPARRPGRGVGRRGARDRPRRPRRPTSRSRWGRSSCSPASPTCCGSARTASASPSTLPRARPPAACSRGSTTSRSSTGAS